MAPVVSSIVANQVNPQTLLAPEIPSASGALNSIMPPTVSTPAILGGPGSSSGGQSPPGSDK